MATAKITPGLIRDMPALAEGAGKLRVFDRQLRGFIAEQRRTGTITFYFRYTDGRGRAREIKLGRAPDVTVEQARRRAEQLKAQVSLGADPAAERARARAVPTLAEFARDRYLPHVREHLRSAGNIDAYLRLRVLPFLGARALDEVTQADVAALRRRLIRAGLSNASVNRHLATLRAMFGLALRWQLYEGRNPAASPGLLREQHRERYLSAAETQALVRALDLEPCQDSAAALALLVVTGARKSEVLLATWDLVDFGRSMLTVSRSKSGKARHIPLSAVAVGILRRQLARRAGGCPQVFPSRRRPGRALEDVRGAWVRAKRAAGLDADLRIHDLRHSFASALANAGVPLFEIGTVLGHTQLSTTARYSHHAPQRLVDTASTAARAWNLLPAPADKAEG